MSFVADWVNGDVDDGYMLANWVVERDVITLNADGKIINVSTKAGFWTKNGPICTRAYNLLSNATATQRFSVFI